MFVLAQSDPCSPETWDDYNYFNNKQMPGGEGGDSAAAESNMDKNEGTMGGLKRGNQGQEQTITADASNVNE